MDDTYETANRRRIVTLTMNPALDVSASVRCVLPTEKMRCSATRYDPGGGGVNVARIAQVLGGSVLAIFPEGGPAGGLLKGLLRDAGVPFRGVPIAGMTRESFTANETSTGQQFRFVLPGPTLAPAEQVQCLDELRAAVQPADFVVASGSLPPGTPGDFYQRVADICQQLGADLILDTSGGGLRHISSGVRLLKASKRELAECVGRELITETDQIRAAQDAIDSGLARVMLVSLGSQGALLVTRETCQRFQAVPMPSGSGVGSGDAMVAAVTVGLMRGWPLEKTVRLGVAAGAAMLMTPGTAVCDAATVEMLFERAPEPIHVSSATATDGESQHSLRD